MFKIPKSTPQGAQGFQFSWDVRHCTAAEPHWTQTLQTSVAVRVVSFCLESSTFSLGFLYLWCCSEGRGQLHSHQVCNWNCISAGVTQWLGLHLESCHEAGGIHDSLKNAQILQGSDFEKTSTESSSEGVLVQSVSSSEEYEWLIFYLNLKCNQLSFVISLDSRSLVIKIDNFLQK